MEIFACRQITPRNEYTVDNVLEKTKQLNIALIALGHGEIHQATQSVGMQNGNRTVMQCPNEENWKR